MIPVRLKNPQSLLHGQALVFDCIWQQKAHQGFLIRIHEQYFTYLNQCMHVPIGLDFDDGDFWNDKLVRIMCKTHGATYMPDTGMCDSGPCRGRKLIALQFEWDQDDILVWSE